MTPNHNFNGLTLQKVIYKAKIGTAGSTQLSYLGPKAIALQQAFNLFLAGWDVTTSSTGEGGDANPVYQIDATYQADLSQAGNLPSGATQPEPVWEVGKVSIQQSLFEIDRPIFTNLSSDTKEKIEKALKNPSLNLPLTSAANIGELPNAMKVYALAQIGVEGKTFNARTVKRTITVPNKFSDNWTSGNEGKVFAQPSLISTYRVPFWIIPKLPDHSPRLTPIDNKTNATLFATYGYLEDGTDYSSVGSNMVQVSTTWTYGRYPVDMFDTL